MRERIPLAPGVNGAVWNYRFSGQWWPRHQHDELEFNLVRSGNATYLVGNRPTTLARGQIVWLHPDQEHHLIQQSTDFHMWIAILKPTPEVLKLHIPRDPPICRVEMTKFRWLDRLCSELSQDGDPQTINAGLAYLFTEAILSGSAGKLIPESPTAHPAVLATIRTLEHDSSNELADLAIAVKMSPDRLTRLFRRELGVTLVAWRTRCRLEAVLRLIDRNHSWLQAAFSVGFGSYSQFHRAFTHHFGVSPRTWAKGDRSGPHST